MFDQSIIVRVRYSSGQRGQTVNLLTMSSVVRIHVSPPLALVFYTSCYAGLAQLARASAFQAEGRGFESRFPLQDWILRNSSFLLGAVTSFLMLLRFAKALLSAQIFQFRFFVVYLASAYSLAIGSYGSEVEHFLGKEEVASSSLAMSSSFRWFASM